VSVVGCATQSSSMFVLTMLISLPFCVVVGGEFSALKQKAREGIQQT
jgi:hypothetical protein